MIYDDGPVMGDRQRYRDIVTKLYIDGIPGHEITWTDEKGKVHRLAPPPSVKDIRSVKSLADLKQLALSLKEGQAAARAASAPRLVPVAGETTDVESSNDG